MKKLAILFFITILMFNITACSPEPETIEGYWMQENGDTVSFNSDGKAIIDGIALDYSIYNENNLSITLLGHAQEYRFNVKNDILTLTDLSNNNVWTFYRDEKKQAEIQENLNQLAAEQAEKERMQQELEAQQQAEENYEKYVDSLKERIDSIDSKVAEKKEYISVNEEYIAEAETQIQYELNRINEIEKEISARQYDTDDFAQADVEIMRGDQEVCYGGIEVCNARIEACNAEIERHKQTISELQIEKENIIAELKDLGEY